MRVFYDAAGKITDWAIIGYELIDTDNSFIDVDNSEVDTINSKQVNITTFDLEPISTYDSDQLIIAKTKAKIVIDEAAGVARTRFITEVPGQALTYQEKAEEAADFVAAGYPTDLSNYPFIQGEMDATGKTKEQTADDILAQKSAWIGFGAEIEKYRIGGKKQVDEAADIETVDTIVATIIALVDAV